MVLGFAGRAFTVMALDTVAGDEGVVEGKGLPVLDGVTLAAAVGGGRVRSGLADRHLVVMAADAGFRGIGQDAVQMAAFATQFPMGAVQCKSGCAVIEVGEGARDPSSSWARRLDPSTTRQIRSRTRRPHATATVSPALWDFLWTPTALAPSG